MALGYPMAELQCRARTRAGARSRARATTKWPISTYVHKQKQSTRQGANGSLSRRQNGRLLGCLESEFESLKYGKINLLNIKFNLYLFIFLFNSILFPAVSQYSVHFNSSPARAAAGGPRSTYVRASHTHTLAHTCYVCVSHMKVCMSTYNSISSNVVFIISSLHWRRRQRRLRLQLQLRRRRRRRPLWS